MGKKKKKKKRKKRKKSKPLVRTLTFVAFVR